MGEHAIYIWLEREVEKRELCAWIASVNKLLVKQVQHLGIPEKNVLKLKIPDGVLIRTILKVC